MMEEILDDDLFLGLLAANAANPRGSQATTKAESAVHAGPWHDSLQADGFQAFLAPTPPGSFGSASTCQQPALWMPAPTNSWKRAFSHSPPLAQEFTAPLTTRQAARSLDRGEPPAPASGLGAHTPSAARSLMHAASMGRSHASTLTTALEPPRPGGTGWAGCLPGLKTGGCPVGAAVDLTSAPAPAAESPQSSGDGPGSSGQRGRSSQQGNSGSPSAATAGKSFKEVHAERNKQAQRRFRQRQKVCRVDITGVAHFVMDCFDVLDGTPSHQPSAAGTDVILPSFGEGVGRPLLLTRPTCPPS